MHKKALCTRIASILKENDFRKSIPVTKHQFTIIDEEGDSRCFTVRKKAKKLLFTIDEVEMIIDAAINVIEDCIRHGEDVTVSSFGSLGVKYRAPHMTNDLINGGLMEVEGRYVPKFTAGKDLKMYARLYGEDLIDKERAGEYGTNEGVFRWKEVEDDD